MPHTLENVMPRGVKKDQYGRFVHFNSFLDNLVFMYMALCMSLFQVCEHVLLESKCDEMIFR